MDYLQSREHHYSSACRGECFESGLIGLTCIELNLTELCNRTCYFCPRHYSDVYPNRPLHMSMETLTRLITQCQLEKYEGEISLAGFGEPLLHPQLVEFVQQIANGLPQVTVTLITNGDHLTPFLVEALATAGLDKIVVSCYDGPKQIPHFAQMLEGNLPFHLKQLWYEDSDSYKRVLRENYFNDRTGHVVMDGPRYSGACYLPFYRMFLDWDGSILLCSNDWGRAVKDLPNLHQKSLRDIWRGEELKRIRGFLAQGNRTLASEACKHCTSVCGTLMGKHSFLVHQYSN